MEKPIETPVQEGAPQTEVEEIEEKPRRKKRERFFVKKGKTHEDFAKLYKDGGDESSNSELAQIVLNTIKSKIQSLR